MPDIIQGFDERFLFFLQVYIKCPALDRFMVFVTRLGDAGLFWILVALIFLFFKRYQKCGLTILLTIKLAHYLGDDILKPLVGRVRPCIKYPELSLLIPAPHSPSFPSGHTMTSFACAAVIYYFDKQLGIASYVLASLIAFSRLYLFVHYPSDVLAGILYGIGCSAVLIPILRSIYHKLKKSNFT